MATVSAMAPGDRVHSGDMSAVFVARTVHPIFPTLMLVIWRVEDDGYGRWSFDALDPRQEIGHIEPSTVQDRVDRLRATLLDN